MAEGVTGKLESDGLAAAGPLGLAIAWLAIAWLAIAWLAIAWLAGPNRMQRQYLSAPTSLE